MTDKNDIPPKKLYVWVVSQDGEYRIRKWDTKPFDEATHECGSLEYLYQELRSAHAEKEAAWKEREKVLVESLEKCLEWMEETRASGDAGYWDWEKGDVYSQGKAALQSKGVE